MSQEFVCNVDGKSFASKEEALHYLLMEYVDEVETANGLEEIKQQIEEALPGFQAEVKKRPYTYEDVRYGKAEDPWFEGKEILDVTLSSPSIHTSCMTFSVLDKYPHQYESHRFQNEFNTLEEALVFYQRFLMSGQQFAKQVYQILSLYIPDLKDCLTTAINQTYGTADSFNEYHVTVIQNDGSTEELPYLELDTSDLESEESLQREINHYLQTLTGRFLTQIEGKVTVGQPKYCNDHSSWFEINGVPIHSLAKRAKKLRVEILELKKGVGDVE